MEPSSSSASRIASQTPHRQSFVSSAKIELRPASSSKSKKPDVQSPADIELTAINPEDTESAKPKETTETPDEPLLSSERSSARPSVSFAALEPAETATTSLMTSEMPTYSSPTRSKERKRWNAVEKADSRKGFGRSLKKMMGCGSSLDAMYDDPMPMVVFGATGLVGGAVTRTLLRDGRFEVKAVTRTPTTDAARKLAEEGAIIVTADLNDPRSLTRALEGAHAAFLVTHYWEHMNKDKEITQGKNCVDAAVASNVAHFVFFGSESPRDVTGGTCGFMETKATIEKHLKNTTLPYTIVRAPFFFENFLGVFKPHSVKKGVFAIAIPMEDKHLEMVSAQDVGRCVLNVLLRPKNCLCRVIPLTGERHSVQHITDIFNKHLSDRKFICPKIRVKDYESFRFEGSKDIAAMFEFYQHGRQEVHDPRIPRKFHGSAISFDRWVIDNKQKLAEAMNVD